jgi:putative membrane protein
VTTEPAAPGWRRLSPRMLIIHPIQELARALPLLLGLLVAGSSSGRGPLWSLVAVAVVTTFACLRWFTTTYRITADQVQVRRGLLRRTTLAVPEDRVRTVDVSANLLHRLLGLARVTVGTGRSDRQRGGEVTLDALVAGDAARLREELLHRRAVPSAGAAEVELARARGSWVRYGPFTMTGLVAVGVLAGFLSHADPARLGPVGDLAGALGREPLARAAAEVVAAAILLLAALSTIGYALAFWRFRLTRTPNGTLHVTRGLVTTRATTIEERRLHGVELSEPLLLRAVGGARCIAIATGLRVGRGAERGGSLLLPPAPRGEARRVAAAVLGRPEPVTGPLVAHGPRARRRRFARALASAAFAIGALVVLRWRAGATDWLLALAPALLAAACLLAADRFRSLGHDVVAGRLVARRGSLVRRRSAVACDAVIGWTIEETWFQRRAGLATLRATTAAGAQRYDVQDLDAGEAVRVAEQVVPGLLAPFRA